MNEAERRLVQLSAAVATRETRHIARALDEAAAGASAAEIEEALLQVYLFLGYPTALEAMRLWRERGGAGESPSVRAADDPAEWRARGERVCARVYGRQYARLRESVARLHADLEQWMLVEGYGKVLGRPGLALRVRELCIVAILVVQWAPRQLYAHLRGALNAGAAPQECEEAIALAAAYAPQAQAPALEVWNELSAPKSAADRA